MTLGSALPWITCSSPLGRIQHRICLPALRNLGVAGHGTLFRARSTSTSAKEPRTSATPSHEQSAEESANHAAAKALSSLVSRLSRIPVRPLDEHGSVVVKPLTFFPHKRESREALMKHHRALTQQIRLDKHRRQDRGGDWRVVLQHLIKSTVVYTKPPGQIKVIIPRHAIGSLLSDHGRNLWNIKARTGCAITLYRPADEGADLDPYVTLDGQSGAISTAVDDILKVTKGVTFVNMGEEQDDSQTGQAPADASADSTFTATKIQPHQMTVAWRPYKLDVRADQIPRPTEWTTEAFQQYVSALVMGDVDASLARRLYPPGKTHKREAVRQLLEAFNDPNASDFISHPALIMALRYLTAGGATYLLEAEELIDRVSKLGLRMDTTIYNLLADTAVYSKNLLAFETTVSQMIVHGHKPDLRTWLLFLRLVEAEDIRRYIIQAMDIKGFLSDPMTANQVSGIMADHDAYRAIQQGQNFDAFLAGLRELYGATWQLHQRAACRYLDVFGQYSKFDESKQLLEYMFKSEHGRPNAVSLNTVLTHCKNQRKVDLAVEFVRMFDDRHYDAADQVTFKLLYDIARRTQKPQLLGAVWRYAHRQDMTNTDMRNHGIMLLAGKENLWNLTKLMRGLWEEPHKCPISRQEFIEALLLCDYSMERSAVLKIEKGRPKKKRRSRKARKATLPSTPDGAPITSRKSYADGELEELLGSSPEEESQPSPASVPLEEADRAQGGDGEQSATLYAAEAYDLYAKAMYKNFSKVAPAVPLGRVLQAALDCDRRLNSMAREGRAPAPGTRVLADMYPVKLPVAERGKRGLKARAMLTWLTWKTQQEEAARAQAQEPGVIDVPGERAEEEALDDWNTMLLAGYEAKLGKKYTP